MRALPDGWVPSPEMRDSLLAEFGSIVDLPLALRRFRNHYSEGQTSRNWDARFENWVIADAERAKEREGTDDLGFPIGQRPRVDTGPQPGDPDYVDIDQLFAAARGEVSVTESEQP